MPVKPSPSCAAVLSGAGGASCLCSGSSSTDRSRSSIVWRNCRSGLASRGASSDSSRSSAISSADSVSAFRPTTAISPSARVEPRDALENRSSADEQAVEVGCRGVHPAQERDLLAGRRVELCERRAAARRGSVGSLFHWAWSRSARDAWISAVSIASCAQRESCSLLRLDRGAHLVGVGDEVADRLVLAVEDRERLGDLLERRVRAPDDLVQLLRPARQADAELGQEQPEALPVRPPHDARDQVGRDRRARPLDRDRAALGKLLLRRADLAVDVVLADQRLVADAALGVGAERVEARAR